MFHSVASYSNIHTKANFIYIYIYTLRCNTNTECNVICIVIHVFFSNGVTIAVFQLLRSVPGCSDRFMILVIAGKMLGRMFFSKVVGIRSSSNDLDLVLVTNFSTWSFSSFLKLLLGCIRLGWLVQGRSSNSFLILTILFKKFANSSASSLSEFLVGSGIYG